MGMTEHIVKNILTEVEKDGVSFESGKVYGENTVEQVAEKMLGRKLEKMPEPIAPDMPQPFWMETEDMVFSRNRNNHIYEIKFYQPLEPAKSIPGKIKRFMKRVIRKLMAPIMNAVIMEQNKFNASVTTSINLLTDNEMRIAEFIRQQELRNQEINSLREEVLYLRREVEKLRKESVEERLETMRTRKRLHREVKLLEEQIETIKGADIYEKIDYAHFENHFRGSVEATKNAQKAYLHYFEGKKNVVDLGCGRGEFLEVLKENNINAVGVDTYSAFVKECREKGLQVYNANAVDYIRELVPASIDGIFAAQLAEHLEAGKLVQLCNDAFEKLEDGGVLIFETPNPTCLSVFTNAFYIDPSHNKPVHPRTLEYVLKEAGFKDVEIIFTENSKIGYRLPLLNATGVANLSEFNDGINCLSDLIFGSQDYAIVARK